MAVVRPERPDEIPVVHQLHVRAFGREDEARLVDAVRRRAEPVISLVATADDTLVGHILFSPVTIQSGTNTHAAVGLGPMAVVPEHQRRGIGSHLVRHGLQECRIAGHRIAVVLGHPWYYTRFGFGLARSRGIHWEQGVPGDAFLVMELHPGSLHGCTGVARYLPEFMSL